MPDRYCMVKWIEYGERMRQVLKRESVALRTQIGINRGQDSGSIRSGPRRKNGGIQCEK
jgi:hypothetical protein